MFHDHIFQTGLLALALVGGAMAQENGPGRVAASRPDPQGQATRVSVAVYIVDVPEVDDARRTFTADVYFILRWRDSRLVSSDASRRIVPLASVWHPGLSILNQRNVNLLLPEVVDVDGQGNVRYRQRFQGTFSLALDLRRFPLDEQNLSVRLVCPGLSPEELELVADESSGRAQEFSILDWTMDSPMSQADRLVTPDGREIAAFTCVLAARRRAGAYVYQFVIPLIFIVAMSWAACWMSPEQLGPRQGIAVTSMLTIIAYRFVLANQLPKVAYLTRFDYLLLGCTSLVFLVLVEVVAAHRLMTLGHPERARRLDTVARAVFPALFLLLLAAVSFF